jgi:hypothetical protein
MIPGDCHPRDPDEVVIEVRSGPDTSGRCRLLAYWCEDFLTPDGVRPQGFVRELAMFAESCRAWGNTVRLVDRRPLSAADDTRSFASGNRG